MTQAQQDARQFLAEAGSVARAVQRAQESDRDAETVAEVCAILPVLGCLLLGGVDDFEGYSVITAEAPGKPVLYLQGFSSRREWSENPERADLFTLDFLISALADVQHGSDLGAEYTIKTREV